MTMFADPIGDAIKLLQTAVNKVEESRQTRSALQALMNDYIWNDRGSKVTHLVPTIDGFDVDEEVPTVCGAVTMYADFGTPEYPLCEDCTKGD